MIRKDIYAVIMAGGKGERFWPASRELRPKQLLNLIGKSTMIEQTVERLSSLIPIENTIIITNKMYVETMQSLLSIPKENIIGEPVGRDTAPCVALATAVIKTKTTEENPILILLSADHVINDYKNLCQVFNDSADLAKTNGNIVTIGIQPTFPSTGYGYIQCGDELSTNSNTIFFESKGFKEKPKKEIAEIFIKDGGYKWNSGMFIWSLNTISDAFNLHSPSLAKLVDELSNISYNDFLKKLDILFPQQEKISIDYAILEKAKNIYIAEATFDWDDIGSWTALRNQIKPDENNNVIRGQHIGLNTYNSTIIGDGKHLISTIGIDNLIIVQTGDATLICNTNDAQNIKELVKKISENKKLKGFL